MPSFQKKSFFSSLLRKISICALTQAIKLYWRQILTWVGLCVPRFWQSEHKQNYQRVWYRGGEINLKIAIHTLFFPHFPRRQIEGEIGLVVVVIRGIVCDFFSCIQTLCLHLIYLICIHKQSLQRMVNWINPNLFKIKARDCGKFSAKF